MNEAYIIHYRLQRNNAKTRRIAWEFTLEEWIKVWADSGKWNQRGRGRGLYVMARTGDVGPYSPSNVSIIPHEQNIKDAHRNGRHPPRIHLKHPFEFDAPPEVVPTELVLSVDSYRIAVRLAWQWRRFPGLSSRSLSELIGAYAPHVSDYLSDDDVSSRRDLPAKFIPAFEMVVGNTLVTQWLSMQSRLPSADDSRIDTQEPACA